MNKKTLRPAIAMIELIFAIVIMGIVLMSAPQLISTASKSGYVVIYQAAINEAASQVNLILGHHWDESDVDELYLDPILQVSGGDSELNENNISGYLTGRRLGTPKESYRTFIRADGQRLSASSVLGTNGTEGNTDDNDFDDMDDFTGTSRQLVEVDTSSADHVETTTIDINRTVVYSSDTAVYNSSDITYDPFSSSGSITNIKSITVAITSSAHEELEKHIILKAFSCNIGGYKLEEKDVN